MKGKRIVRWMKRGFVVVIGLITLGFLVVAFENYRGRKAWDRYHAEAEARGERLDMKSFLPVGVPDDQNFAATPILAPLFDGRIDQATGHWVYADSNRVSAVNSLFEWQRHLPTRGRGWRQGEAVDLAAWQEALRGATNKIEADLKALQLRPAGEPGSDLLYLLAQQRDAIEEIRLAAQRPHTQVPVESYDAHLASFMSYFGVSKGFARAFQTKALAELAQGDTEAASGDVETILNLSATLKREPFLISGLVRLATLALVHQPIWEGLARRQWTDDQLVRFESELSGINLVEETAFWLRGERAFSLSFFAPAKKGQVSVADGAGPGPDEILSRMPAGWRYQNQVEIAKKFDRYVLPVLHPDVPMVDVARNLELEIEARELTKTRHPYRILAAMLVPAVQRAALKSARGQAELHLARVACVLERYYLVEGDYPERLDALTPRFISALPPDPVNGEPLRYQRIDGGRFILYSLGTDLDDDGGRFAPDRRKPDGEEPDGDWVWRYDAP